MFSKTIPEARVKNDLSGSNSKSFPHPQPTMFIYRKIYYQKKLYRTGTIYATALFIFLK